MISSDSAYQLYLRDCQAGVPVEVVLGSPDHENCAYFGVCKIFFTSQARILPACVDRVSAYLRWDGPTERVLLHFIAATITDDVRDRHFINGFFRIEAAYELEEEVRYELGLAEGVALQPGRYPVMDDEDLLTVSLRTELAVATTLALAA